MQCEAACVTLQLLRFGNITVYNSLPGFSREEVIVWELFAPAKQVFPFASFSVPLLYGIFDVHVNRWLGQAGAVFSLMHL